jgi:hypothetical protein
MHRDEKLLELRPLIKVETDISLPEETFANLTIRPILMLQHHLVVSLFNHYLEDKAIRFNTMSAFKQRLLIENAVKRDLPLRHTLMGCIIGHFTVEEYGTYFSNKLAFHKRLTSLLIQRLSDTFIKPDTIQ